MFLLVLSVAKVARCVLRKNNIFMLLIDLSVAKVADAARFSGVRGVGCNNALGLSEAKVAKCMLHENNKFTLVFDSSVAEVADVAGFSGVRGVQFNNFCACIVSSKSSKMQVTYKQHFYACDRIVGSRSSRSSRVFGCTGGRI